MKEYFCIVCNAFNFYAGPLCLYCSAKVESRERDWFLRFFDSVPHYYLFEWTPRTDTFCRGLVYYLKNKPVSQFQGWVDLFPEEVFRGVSGQSAVVPGSQSQYNHARGIAEACGKLSDLSCVIELGAFGGPQKKKTRLERLAASSSTTSSVDLSMDMGWVFIDDVFVTGGTYNKVLNAVGKKQSVILTLFNRPLCEEFLDD